MNASKKTEENIIILINSLKGIMTIFLGPFLTAYFIKISKDSIVDLSIYYIFSYLLLGIGTFVVARIIKNKFKLGMFRIGVILNCIYIISIIILREKIIKYLWMVSILYGISASSYWLPFNLFVANKVENSKRTEYTVKSRIILCLVGILAPLILGTIITVTNYELTAVIILFISIIQIIFSFILKQEKTTNYSKTNYKKIIEKMKNNKSVKKLCLLEILTGMNISDAALKILITVIIFNSFKTNLNLGIINSLTVCLSMICVYLYGKKFKYKEDKIVIIISSILPVIALFIFLIFKNNVTLILYNIFYIILIDLLKLTREIRIYNIFNSNDISKEEQCDIMALRELMLNIGRIIGYLIMLVAGICNNQFVLNMALIILTLSMPIMGFVLSKMGKYENSSVLTHQSNDKSKII